MDNQFRVSSVNLFPVMIEMLNEGQSVRFIVSGNSMWPLISHNRDSVLLVPCNNTDLSLGDIILFKTGETHYVLHRITKCVNGGYITTGDGNTHRDGFVAYDNVIARVKYVYHKDMVIDCDKKTWKFIFRVWMILYPIRPILLRLFYFVVVKCK